MPVCSSGVVEGVFEGIETTMCELKSQPVHACAGNPSPLRKVAGQGSQSQLRDGLLEQECRQSPLLSRPKDQVSSEPCETREVRMINPCTLDASRHDESLIKASNEPKASSKRRAGRYIPELTDDVKTRANPLALSPSKELGPDQRTG